MKCMAQTKKCMDQITPKTAKSGPKSFPFREDPCLVSKHPPFCPFCVIFSMHDDWLIHFFDYSTIKHHIWFSKEYKNTQLAFKWNALWLNIEEISFEFMCHLVHACLHSCVPVCVCVNQTEQLLFLMATPDNAVSVSERDYLHRESNRPQLWFGVATLPYGIASLEG